MIDKMTKYWIIPSPIGDNDNFPIFCNFCARDIGIIDEDTGEKYGYRPVTDEELTSGYVMLKYDNHVYREHLHCFGVPCVK